MEMLAMAFRGNAFQRATIEYLRLFSFALSVGARALCAREFFPQCPSSVWTMRAIHASNMLRSRTASAGWAER